MENREITFSIVIAAYNVEKFLSAALDSCIHQTYKNIEIIAVDDGSTDGSPRILEDYARRDSRVRAVYHAQNRGSLVARLTGIREATGDYIIFLDGDDYYTPNACKKLEEYLSGKKVDVLQFGMQLVNAEEADQTFLQGLRDATRPYTKGLQPRELALLKACFGQHKFCWNFGGKAWRMELARKTAALISDMRLILAEDLLFNFVSFLLARSYGAVSDELYCYRMGCGCTTSTGNWRQKVRSFAESYQVIPELERITGALGLREQCGEELSFVRERLTMDAASHLVLQVPGEEMASAVDLLMEYWPGELLLPALTAVCYQEHRLSGSELMHRVYRAKCFQVRTRKIKTVGMFYYRYYSGGIERVASVLTQLLVREGYRVVLFSDQEPDPKDYPFPQGVKRITLPNVDRESMGDLDACIRRMDAYTKAIREEHVDVILYHAWISERMPLDAMAIRWTGIPMIVHTHGDFAMGFRFRDSVLNEIFTHQKDYYQLANCMVTLSDLDQYWWSSLGYPCRKTVNPAPFDCGQVKPLTKREGKDILWIGRLCEQKAPLEAVKVMELVHREEPEAVLRMVGMAEGTFGEQVRDYICEHGMEKYCILEGYSSDMARFYSSSAVLLWTAVYEGMPVAMIESKVYGLPMVSYEIANLDMIREAKGIAVVPQKDAQGAAREVVRLLREEDYWNKMRDQARASGEELAGFDIAENWRSIFALALEPAREEVPARCRSVDCAAILYLNESVAAGFQAWKHSSTEVAAGAALAGIYSEVYEDGFLVKLFGKFIRLTNWLLPIGSRRREGVKKLAGMLLGRGG